MENSSSDDEMSDMSSDYEISSKCDIKASELRNEGNNFYKQSEFHEALLKYNESLCFAETNEILALAYANRSAVYLEIEYFEQCLNNIRLAREHNYPIEKIKTLNDREVRCKEQQGSRKLLGPHDPFKLSYKANKKIPFIIKGLKLESDEKFGRKIVAKQSLEVGDIICIESAYFKTRENGDPKTNFNFCSLCYTDNYMDLLPCAGCTNTMFCIEDCENHAQQKYHKLQCAKNSKDDYLKILFFKALDVMNRSIEDLQQLFEECLKSPKTIFDFDFSNQDDPEYSKNQLKAFLSLARKNTSLRYVFDPTSSTLDQFFQTFLNHLNQIVGAVAMKMVAWKFSGSSGCVLGGAVYLLSALVNHSCAPNVMRNFYKDKMCLMVIRPIKKGEQLFDTYCLDFTQMPVSERQEFLKNYSFKCDCVACLDPETYKVVDVDDDKVADQNYSMDKILEQRGLKYLMSYFKQTLQKLHSQKHFTSPEYKTKLIAFHLFLLRLSSQD